MRTEFDSEELYYGAQMWFRTEGQLEAANVLKNIRASTLNSAKKYKKIYHKVSVVAYSFDKALSILVEAKLTKF